MVSNYKNAGIALWEFYFRVILSFLSKHLDNCLSHHPTLSSDLLPWAVCALSYSLIKNVKLQFFVKLILSWNVPDEYARKRMLKYCLVNTFTSQTSNLKSPGTTYNNLEKICYKKHLYYALTLGRKRKVTTTQELQCKKEVL